MCMRGAPASTGCLSTHAQSALQKICRDTNQLAAEQVKGLCSLLTKRALFNCGCNPHRQAAAAAAGLAPVAAGGTSSSNMET